jgi:hypothetical protein
MDTKMKYTRYARADQKSGVGVKLDAVTVVVGDTEEFRRVDLVIV